VKNNKLDVSKKELVTLKGISRCKDITWLDVSSNQLDSLQWIKKLKHILVLKASNNRLRSIHHVLHLESLKALILNNNCIESTEGIEKLLLLNSLVLSHNELQTIDVSSCKNLTKLSLSHNKFKQFPNIEHLSDLKELRLNDNQIRDIPLSIASCKKLKLIDLGNNKLTTLGFLETLSKTTVENLNLKGNHICSLPDYKEKILDSLPYLKVLDGRRIDGKEKRKSDLSAGTSMHNEVTKPSSTVVKEKSGKSKLDSKNRPVKVGGFVSRFSQSTAEPENTVSESESKKGNKENLEVPSSIKHSTKEISKQKKRKRKSADNFEVQSPKIGKIELCDNEASFSIGENLGVSKVKNNLQGKYKKEAKDVENMIETSSISRKIKERKDREEFQGAKKQKKILKAKKVKAKDGDGTVNISVSNKSEENAKKTADSSRVSSSESQDKLEKKSKEERPKKKASIRNSKSTAKQSRLDKRSGVVAVKVIKRKQEKGTSINVEALEGNQVYEIGVGEGGGW